MLGGCDGSGNRKLVRDSELATAAETAAKRCAKPKPATRRGRLHPLYRRAATIFEREAAARRPTRAARARRPAFRADLKRDIKPAKMRSSLPKQLKRTPCIVLEKTEIQTTKRRGDRSCDAARSKPRVEADLDSRGEDKRPATGRYALCRDHAQSCRSARANSRAWNPQLLERKRSGRARISQAAAFSVSTASVKDITSRAPDAAKAQRHFGRKANRSSLKTSTEIETPSFAWAAEEASKFSRHRCSSRQRRDDAAQSTRLAAECLGSTERRNLCSNCCAPVKVTVDCSRPSLDNITGFEPGYETALGCGARR